MNDEKTNIVTNEGLWSLEDLQEKVQTKLANIFSFYNEQEFLDEINGVVPAIDVIEIDID